MQQYIKILLIHIYMKLNVFRATHCPSSRAKTALAASGSSYVEGCWTWSGTYCAWQRPPTTHPTTFHVWRTRGCQCSFRLLMMGGVSPETCWALYKYELIKFWHMVASCWIFLYEFYNEARIHEHQGKIFLLSCLHLYHFPVLKIDAVRSSERILELHYLLSWGTR